MSDDFLDADDEVGGDAGASEGSKKRVGFLPAIVIQILKWAAIVIGLIIFVVTIVIVTLNIIGAGSPGQARTDITEDYAENLPIYEYYALDELRGVTADEVRNTYVVTLQIGYDEGDKVTNNEIIRRRIQIVDQVSLWFASQRAAYLLDARNRAEIQQKLKALINQIMARDVREVRFTNYQVLNF